MRAVRGYRGWVCGAGTGEHRRCCGCRGQWVSSRRGGAGAGPGDAGAGARAVSAGRPASGSGTVRKKKTADDELGRGGAAGRHRRGRGPVAGRAVDRTIRFRTVRRHRTVRRGEAGPGPAATDQRTRRVSGGITAAVDDIWVTKRCHCTRRLFRRPERATSTPGTRPLRPSGRSRSTAAAVPPSELGGSGTGRRRSRSSRIDVDRALAARDGSPTYPAFGELISSTPGAAGASPRCRRLTSPTRPAARTWPSISRTPEVRQWFLVQRLRAGRAGDPADARHPPGPRREPGPEPEPAATGRRGRARPRSQAPTRAVKAA